MSRAIQQSQPVNDEPTSRFAPLSDDDIMEMTDSGSFSRGRTYFRQGAIVDPVLTGDTISAGCWGSEVAPYQVSATLALEGAKDKTPTAFACTCPRGGFCKHIVALLLTWIDNPLVFEARPGLAELLADRSPAGLIAIIERLVTHDPELYRLVELPVAGESAAPAETTVNPAAIRRQVAAIFRMPRYDDWHSSREIAADLDEVLRIGQSCAGQGAWANAVTIFIAMAAAMIEHYNQLDDSEGDLAGILIDCDTGLAQCLDAQASLPQNERLPAPLRHDVIRAIFDIWRFDIYDVGGADMSQEGPEALVRAATEAEREEVLGWLTDLLRESEKEGTARTSDVHRDWTRRATIGFEVMFKEEAGLAPEELAAIYRDNEMWAELTWLLLDQGQITEAVAVAGRHLTRAHDLVAFATALRDLGGKNVELAIDLVDARLWEAEGKNPIEDDHLRLWLETTYANHGDQAKALEMARRRFKNAPSVTTYQAVRKVATAQGQPEDTWPGLRAELLRTLRGKRAWSDLVQIALDEGDVPAAVAALAEHDKTTTARTGGWSTTSAWFPGLDIKVAEAAEQTMPDEAIRLYRRAAGQAIEGRGRGNYQQAAEYLARVKRILEANERTGEWMRLITELRAGNKRLRALMEELDARKLT